MKNGIDLQVQLNSTEVIEQLHEITSAANEAADALQRLECVLQKLRVEPNGDFQKFQEMTVQHLLEL